MQSDWPRCLLEDLAASQQGAIAIGPFGSRLKTDLYTEHGVALIRGTNLAGSKFFAGEFVYVSEETARGLGNANVKPWDLVFPHRGNIGAVGLVPEGSQRYALSTSLMKVTLDRKRADPLFLYYFFRSPQGQAELLKNASQVGTPGIATPLTSLRACVVPVPPVEEQVPAAQLLSLLDDRIDLLRQTNATLESIAQALFKSWFIDFDPVRAKAEGREPLGLDAATAALFPAEFEESALGVIPKGWRVGPVEELFVLQRGFDLPASQRTDGRYIVFAASGPHGTHAEAMAKGPGVVTGRSGVIGKVFFAHDDYWPLNTALWVKEFKRASPAFAFQFLQTMDLMRLNAGSAVPSLNRNHVHVQMAVIPPVELVSAFTALAMPLLQRVHANETHAARLSALRDTLLSRLISGKLRLTEAREQVEEVI